jgi:hypothetical protein
MGGSAAWQGPTVQLVDVFLADGHNSVITRRLATFFGDLALDWPAAWQGARAQRQRQNQARDQAKLIFHMVQPAYNRTILVQPRSPTSS